jgi:hypothetical protein
MLETLKKVVLEIFGGMTEPHQIAELCRASEIVGFKQNVTSCPMVKLVRSQVDFMVGFTMNNNVGYWWCFTKEGTANFQSLAVCERFSTEFDNGKYPDLFA